MTKHDWQTMAREVLQQEADAIEAQMPMLGEGFSQACATLLSLRGHVVVMGLGKSGHIGAKIAATLASTGTPAFFVHATEAGHGDLGMIGASDALLALSFSGECNEILTILPVVKALGVPVLALTGRPESRLAAAADIVIPVAVAGEACPLGLAPTCSTTATLALGDALAVALMRARAFSAQDFARSHPEGRLGRRLMTTVHDVMRTGDAIPQVAPQATVQEALFQITAKGLGATLICHGAKLHGIFTDGDLRRTLAANQAGLTLPITQVMTAAPQTISATALAAEALQRMEAQQITVLPVLADGKVAGMLSIHDLLRAGVA